MRRLLASVRIAVALLFVAGLFVQGLPVRADSPGMSGLHAAVMETMGHDMSGMAQAGPAAPEMTGGLAGVCKQHCMTVAVVMPAGPAKASAAFAAEPLSWPDARLPASRRETPDHPPPKALLA